jgi:hypothetical protein
MASIIKPGPWGVSVGEWAEVSATLLTGTMPAKPGSQVRTGVPVAALAKKSKRLRPIRQAQVVAPVSDQLKYTINQAAQRLGCCPRTVHNLCAKGKLHKRYENRKPYILHSDIMSYLKTLPRIPTA